MVRLVESRPHVGLCLSGEPLAFGKLVFGLDKVRCQLSDFAVQRKTCGDGFLLFFALCLAVLQAFLCHIAAAAYLFGLAACGFDAFGDGRLLLLDAFDDPSAFGDTFVVRSQFLDAV